MCKTDLEKLRSVTVEDKLNYIRNIGIFVGIIQFGLRHGISGPSNDHRFHVRVLIWHILRTKKPIPSFLLVYFKLEKYRNFYQGVVSRIFFNKNAPRKLSQPKKSFYFKFHLRSRFSCCDISIISRVRNVLRTQSIAAALLPCPTTYVVNVTLIRN